MKDTFPTYFSLKNFKKNIPKFITAGLFSLSLLLLTAIVTDIATDGAVKAALEDISASSLSVISEKQLPIYCVKTDKKQIALTFDGAWEDIMMMEL